MNSTNEFVFGNLLVQYRKRADLTQEELARELKVSRNTISNWETGRGRPQHREDILALEDILRLSREEVNQLLAAADFPIQYDTGQLHQALSPELDTLHVTRLTAETLEVKGAALVIAHKFKSPWETGDWQGRSRSQPFATRH